MLSSEDLAGLPRKIWTRQEAHALVDLGLPNAGKLELIEGELIDRMGKNHPHILWQNLVLWWLQDTFGREYVRTEAPTDVASDDNRYSEPEPDLMVTAKNLREYNSNPNPGDIRLAVEISDSTKQLDLGAKARLYARAEIMEYWVVNIQDQQVVVHRDPHAGAFHSVRVYNSSEQIAPLAAPFAVFCLDRL